MTGPTEDPNQDETPVEEELRRSRRSVTFIVGVVVASLVAIAALALWAVALPVDAEVVATDGTTISCDEASSEACEVAEEEARDDRRKTAILIGAGVFVVATAVSTWPSRRLTGERLGPLRP